MLLNRVSSFPLRHRQWMMWSVDRWRNSTQTSHTVSPSCTISCCTEPRPRWQAASNFWLVQYSLKHVLQRLIWNAVAAKNTSAYSPGAAEGNEKWGSNTHSWRAREREPIMGVSGRSPQRGSRGQSPRWSQGGEAPCTRRGFCI